MASPRVGWIDRARAAGAVSIVLLHVLVSTNIAAELSVGRLVVYDLVSVTLTRWAVPAFFMLSGYLLLRPERAVTWASALTHAKRMVLALATFGFVFALMEEVVNARAAGQPLGVALLGASALDVVQGRSWDHLWYVYAQLAIYLLLVPLRALRERAGERLWRVLVALAFTGVLVVPTLMRYELPNVAIGLACFCAGSLLDDFAWPPVAGAGVASLAVMLVVSVKGIVSGIGDEGYIFLQGSFLATIWGVFVLCALKRYLPAPLAEGSRVALVARDSFGIYLIHPLFIHLILMAVSPEAVPPVVFEVATFSVTLAATVCSVALCRRVPVLKDVV